MKKLFSCLLIAVMLLSVPIIARADDENPGNTGSGSSSQIVVVPSEADLPEGYVIDPDYSYTFTIDAESGWTYTLEDLIGANGDDGYIYFFVEENVAEGYTPEYFSGNPKGRAVPGITSGNVIVVRNIRDGDAPTYELPKTGGSGTTVYMVAGTAILLIAAVYGMILLRNRKRNA